MRNLICPTLLLLAAALPAAAQIKMDTTFTGVSDVTLSTGAGGVRIVQSADTRLRVELNASYGRSAFTPIVRKSGNSLRLEEEFHRSNNRGRSSWILHVPVGTEVRFESGAGSLSAENVAIELEARTGSGSYTLRGMTGDADLSSGSGSLSATGFTGDLEFEAGSGSARLREITGEVDIRVGSGSIQINGLEGGVEATTGSGSIRVQGLAVLDDSEFETGSGQVRVTLAAAPLGDLDLSSGSGSAVLDFNGAGIQGRFTLSALRGRVSFPYPFDSLEETRDGGQRIRVTGKATVGSADVDIRVTSGSGRAVVER